MISAKLHVALFAAVIIYFVLLGVLLKKNKFLLKYSLLWIFAGIMMLVLAVFPRLLSLFAEAVGIMSPVNALFAIILFCMIFILVSLTAIVSALNEKVKRLVQNQALLEARLEEAEKNNVQKQ